jgi:CSLREA domain-containing protein
MKAKARYCLSILAISALLALPAMAQTTPQPPVMVNKPGTGMSGSANQAPEEAENAPESNIVVTTIADNTSVDDMCSLREAVEAAYTNIPVDTCTAGVGGGVDTITFSVSGAITLNNTLLIIGGGPLVIDGGGEITISGGNSVRLFSVYPVANLTLANLTLVNGYGDGSGGAIENLGTVVVRNSTLTGNSASYRGGAIVNDEWMSLINTTLSGNFALNGGGAIANYGDLFLRNITISANSTYGNGGGIFMDLMGGGSFSLRNTIVANNYAGVSGSNFSATVGSGTTFGSDGYNLIGNTDGSVFHPTTGDLTNIDPKLGPLQDNGGPTFTHALLSGSLAIDRGDPDGCTDHLGSLLTTDQRGFLRSGRCDIGAYEWQPEVAVGPYKVYLPCVLTSCSSRLFFDDFSYPGSGWPVLDYPESRYEYLANEYRIWVKTNDWWAGAHPGFKASDYIVSVDVRNAGGVYGSYGLLFGLSEDWSQFYSFEVDSSGYYAIWRHDTYDQWALLAWGDSGSIQTGAATNQLNIERKGSQIWAYANGELLNILQDGAFMGLRYVGLIAVSFTQPNADARFDNFTMNPITCGASNAYPDRTLAVYDLQTAESIPLDNWGGSPHARENGK